MELLQKIDMFLNEAYNEHNVRELVLFITNDHELYKQRITPIMKNLKKHMEKGRFDKTESLKSWKRVADEGAKKYDKQFSTSGAKTFSVADRKQAAIELADEYEEELNYVTEESAEQKAYARGHDAGMKKKLAKNPYEKKNKGEWVAWHEGYGAGSDYTKSK